MRLAWRIRKLRFGYEWEVRAPQDRIATDDDEGWTFTRRGSRRAIRRRLRELDPRPSGTLIEEGEGTP